MEDLENKTKCMLCLGNEASVIPGFCKCKENIPLLCIKCFINIWNSKQRKCPKCSSNTNVFNFDSQMNVGDIYTNIFVSINAKNSSDLYKCLKTYLTGVKQSNGDEQDIVTNIVDMYKKFYKEEKVCIRLTVDQIEDLLEMYDLLGNYYKIHQLLVCLCEYPWKVDVKLGRSGVCYFGNLGDRPRLSTLASMIVTNEKVLNGIDTFK